MSRVRISITGALAAIAMAAMAAAIPAALAAPSDGGAPREQAAPLARLAQDNYHGGYTNGWGWGWGYNYIPACPANYHYACWADAYGYRRCGCVPYRHW